MPKKAKFTIWRSKADGRFYFNFRGKNGRVVCWGEAYMRRGGSRNAVKCIKREAADAEVVEE